MAYFNNGERDIPLTGSYWASESEAARNIPYILPYKRRDIACAIAMRPDGQYAIAVIVDGHLAGFA